MGGPLVIAHRGASGYEVENSLAAFRAAHTLGADAVELDVHATADGALVVHHDEMIGPHHIAHCSLKEVRAQPLKNGESVPTLEEALAVIHP
ncbi:MAG: glycerophosphodiester phosphodiesterase family protein, partial [Gemmatimonadales bacterium]|nr:glycerophosphodiester phosphodiesterase family protein [Gemmatimonadales bacterium]